MKRNAPIIVLLSAALVGTGMTAFVKMAADRAAQAQFEVVANEAADRIERRVNQSILLLVATAAHMKTSLKPLGRGEFASFMAGLNLNELQPGIRGIGFAVLLPAGQEAQASRLIHDNYAMDRSVWPQSGEEYRTPIVLIEPPDERNRAALGYDMYSDATRRNAISQSMTTGKPVASAPVSLVQETTIVKQKGFLIYVPVSFNSDSAFATGSRVSGFIYTPARALDFHQAALQDQSLPTEYQTVDPAAGDTVLAQSRDYDAQQKSSPFHASRLVKVAGRIWEVRFAANAGFAGHNWELGTLLLGFVSLLLAVALATSTRSQLVAVEKAEQLAGLSQRSLDEKDMLLQEMKHRIKNSITRVLAIARQTASSSENLEAFAGSFFSRLQSMAAAQELLTRSHYQRAQLRDLLHGEMTQVLGETWNISRMTGPDIALSERATQALGLTFHELATNALKYGDPEGIKEGLAVHWALAKAGPSMLELEWFEPGSKDQSGSSTGFGSRLITMNIERELRGTIDRLTTPAGLLIRLRIPTSTLH